MLYFEDLQDDSFTFPGSYTLSEEEIISFAKRWDPQPFHVDPEFAAKSPMQGLFASSAHSYAIAALLLNGMQPPAAGIGSLKHEMELPAPARPGDTLSLSARMIDKRTSATKPDRGLITLESELSNQHGVVVLRLRSLMLVKRKPL